MTQLTPLQAKKLLDQNNNVLLVDARTEDEFRISHLPEAINIPVDMVEKNLALLSQHKHVIVYCNSGNTSASFLAKTKKHNLTHISHIVGGMSLWQKDGYDIIKKKNVIPLMRQVFIAAGGLILLGVGLWYFVNPYFLLISTFVGCGLMFAGISGICGMTKILAFMPWNRVTSHQKINNFVSKDKTIHIHQFEDKDLSHYSYALLSSSKIVLVDPVRDPQQYYDYAEQHEASIVGVIETHPHADFASGHLEIAQTTGAKIYVSDLVGAEYDHVSFDDGDSFQIGNATLHAINTPGHSPDSISILVKDNIGQHVAVFSGDTLFVGDVGRADLRESVGNIQQLQEDLAKAMYDSTRNKLMTLHGDTLVLPAHGAGTLCGKGLRDENYSTIQQENKTNPALQSMTKQEFVSYLTHEQPAIPKYFGHSVLHNKMGFQSLEKARSYIFKIQSSDIDATSEIVDTRSFALYSTHSLPGAINIPLGPKFPTIVGSLYDSNQKVFFVVSTELDFEQLSVYLLKIGYETICAGVVVMEEEIRAIYTMGQTTSHNNYRILDVRSPSAVAKNPVFADKISLRIPLAQLVDRLDELPKDKVIVPYCGGSYQSDIALSIIKKNQPEIAVHRFTISLLEILQLHA